MSFQTSDLSSAEDTTTTDNPAYALAWSLNHFAVKEANPEASTEAIRAEFKRTQSERLRLAHKVIAALERNGFRLVKAVA